MDFFQYLAIQYHETKQRFSHFTGASENLLHVHAGLLIFVVAALVLRRHMRSPYPLLCVLFFALANEGLDVLSGTPSKPLEPYIDIVNTVFWPLMLFLLARRLR